jgi:hypothetical protein
MALSIYVGATPHHDGMHAVRLWWPMPIIPISNRRYAIGS